MDRRVVSEIDLITDVSQLRLELVVFKDLLDHIDILGSLCLLWCLLLGL